MRGRKRNKCQQQQDNRERTHFQMKFHIVGGVRLYADNTQQEFKWPLNQAGFIRDCGIY